METQIKNWNDLNNLMDVHTLTPADNNCLDEIQRVIEKHQLTHKFGVSLLHQHFQIDEDEVLLESNNPSEKTLMSRAVKHEAINSDDYAVTQWRFDGGMKYGCAFCKKNHCDTEDMQ